MSERPSKPTPPPPPLEPQESEQTLDGDELLDLLEEVEEALEEGLDDGASLPPPVGPPPGPPLPEAAFAEDDAEDDVEVEEVLEEPFDVEEPAELSIELVEETLHPPPTPRPQVIARPKRATLPPQPPPEARPRGDHPVYADARRVAEAAEAELSAEPERARALWLHRTLARLYEAPLGDPRRAAVHWGRARALDAECAVSAQGLRRVLTALGRHTEALALFEGEAVLTARPDRRAAILWDKAVMLDDVLGELDESRRVLGRAFTLSPHDPALMEARARADLDAGDWPSAIAALGRLAEAEREAPAVRAALLSRQAQVVAWRADDRALAATLYEQALELEGPLASGPEEAAELATGAMEALCTILEAEGRWGPLVPVLRARARWTSDAPMRARIHTRIADLLITHFQDLDGGVKALEEALSLTPDDRVVLQRLADVCVTAGRMKLLEQVLLQQVELARTPGSRIGHLHRLARLRQAHLDDRAGAVGCYTSILKLDPLEVVALQALGRLYREAEEWPALIQVCLAEAEAANHVGRQAEAFKRVARIYAGPLQSPPEAIEHYEAALRRAPKDSEAFKALERLYGLEGRHQDLVELYDTATDVAPTAAHLLRCHMASGALYEGPLSQPARAMAAYRQALALRPDHLPAVHGLQRAAEAAEDEEALVEALDLEIAGAEQADGLQYPEQSFVEPHVRQTALLVRSVQILAEGDLAAHPALGAQAVKRIQLALSLDPENLLALETAAEVYTSLGRWRDLLAVWVRRLPLVADPQSRVAMRFEMGQLAEGPLADEALAVTHYTEVLRMAPTHEGGLEMLLRIYGAQGRWARAAEVLEAALVATSEPGERAQIHLRLAHVYESRLEQVEEALAHYEAARKLHPEDRRAIDGLDRIRCRLGRFDEVAAELEGWAPVCPEPRWAVEALLQAGALYVDVLDAPEAALRCYKAVAEISPHNLMARQALADLHRQAGRIGESVEHLSHRVQATVVQAVASVKLTALRAQARALALVPEDDGHLLRTTLEEILELEPDDPRALSGLLALALKGDRPDLLAHVGPPLARISADPRGAADHWTSAGEAFEVLGRAEDALKAHKAALGADEAALGAVRGLVRTGRALDAPEVLAEGHRRQAALTADDVAAARLLVESAHLCLGPADSPSRACDDLVEALRRCPAHEAAAELLTSTLVELRQAERLVHHLTAAARALDPEQDRARVGDLWLQIAQVYADELLNTGAALTALRRLLKRSPGHLSGLLYTAEIYARDQQWSAAESALVQAVDAAPEGAGNRVRRETLLKITRLRADRLKDQSGALESAEAALRLKRDDREALTWVARLERAKGNLDAAADTASRRVQASVEPKHRVDALMQLARIELDRGGRVGGPGAAAALREAVVIEGPRGEAWTEYMKVVEAYDGWENYADALGRHLRTLATPESPHVDRWLELARVQSDRLGEPREALEILDEARRLAPEEMSLKLESAERLIDAGAHSQAVSSLGHILAERPRAAQAWQLLRQAWSESGQRRAAELTGPALQVLGAAGGHGPKAAADISQIPDGALDGGALDEYAAEASEIRPWSQALALAAEGISRARPSEPGALGISSRDRLSSRADHPVRHLIDTLAGVFHVSGFEVYLRPERGRTCQVALGKAPLIVVDEGLTSASTPVQVFRVARIMAYLARGLHPVAALDTAALEEIFRALRRIGAPVAEPDAEHLDDLLRRILKGTPRRHRKALEDMGRAISSLPGLDVGPWRDRVAVDHERVAVMLAADLKAVVDRGGPRARDPKTVDALLAGWCAPGMQHLRRRCGWV